MKAAACRFVTTEGRVSIRSEGLFDVSRQLDGGVQVSKRRGELETT